MKYRQQFKCWNCCRQYSSKLPQEEVASFIVECPYCHSEATVDLAEIPKAKDILRSPSNNSGDIGNNHFSGKYQWPDLIETRPDKT